MRYMFLHNLFLFLLYLPSDCLRNSDQPYTNTVASTLHNYWTKTEFKDYDNVSVSRVKPANFPFTRSPDEKWMSSVPASAFYRTSDPAEAKNLSPAMNRLPNGLWNCSVSALEDVPSNFRCNITSECAGGEDERDCPYSGHCGQGYLTILQRCYRYVATPTPVTWFEAAERCVKDGGQLVSLNTKDEWDAVTGALDNRTSRLTYHVGLVMTPPSLPDYYKGTFQWADQTIAYFSRLTMTPSLAYDDCGEMVEWSYRVASISMYRMCSIPSNAAFLCEQDSGGPEQGIDRGSASRIDFRLPIKTSLPLPSVRCPEGHFTLRFLACDLWTFCWAESSLIYGDVTNAVSGRPSRHSCPVPVTSSALPPSFSCGTSQQVVAYSLVCDGRADCLDGSDEDFCLHPLCPRHKPFRCQSSRQCVPDGRVCNGQADCHDNADEADCWGEAPMFRDTFLDVIPPVVINLNATQWQLDLPVQFIERGAVCPETHFQCLDEGYCLPVYTRCNGVFDCPNHEDEADCATYTCPGFYRCRGTKECLHADHVCDGLYQCPQKDDELFCHLTCPENCTCHGLAYICSDSFPPDEYRDVRYLDASGSGLTPDQLTNNTLLIFLSLANCGLRFLHSLTFANLHVLDVSDNLIHDVTVEQLSPMVNLRTLALNDNPITSTGIFMDASPSVVFRQLRVVSLASTDLSELRPLALSPFPELRVLNLSHSGVEAMGRDAFSHVSKLLTLDLRGCPVTHFAGDVLRNLRRLRAVQADNYKLCCPAVLPDSFNQKDCRAPASLVSSCDDLLRSNLYRVLLTIFAALSLTGNLGSFVLRLLWLKVAGKSGFAVLVTHLSLSDLLMGVYLVVVGTADRLYLGSYLWQDVTWRASVACQVAGFLSLLSSEVSACVVSLITADRFLTLRFPFSQVRFSRRSALAACSLTWAGCALLAAAPFLPPHRHWDFYGQTGICFPMPISPHSFAGQHFAFSVLIVFNFVLFLFIAAGQAFIFLAVRSNRMEVEDGTRKSQNVKIARRLLSVAVSDFLCWFPIGLLGLLASRGVAVPGEVNVALAILVLPLNSALNPFLYTINVIMEKRRRRREKRLLDVILAGLPK